MNFSDRAIPVSYTHLVDFRHIGSVQIDMSRTDGINGGNTVEQGSLAGTGCSHDSYKFSLLNGKANVLNCFCNIPAISVIFLDMIQGIYAFFLGMVLGYICEKGGSIYQSILFHMMFNLDVYKRQGVYHT